MPHSILQCEQHAQHLLATWDDGSQSHFDFLWLRDNCPSGLHPSTRERNFDLLSVPDTIAPEATRLTEEGLEVDWNFGEHRSSYSYAWLREWDDARGKSAQTSGLRSRRCWDSSYLAEMPRTSIQALLEDDQVLLNWLLCLRETGLVLVDNVPADDSAMEAMARRIAHMRETNFGVIFEVESKPVPNNQAYTSDTLNLHTDLPNQEMPPGYQLLHCLENSAEGGHSIFADGISVAEALRNNDPEAFKLLASVRIPYRFHDADYDLRQHKTVIVLDQDAEGAISEVNFNPGIASIFQLGAELTRPYYTAYREFMSTVRDPQFLVQFKLEPGEMAVFDNRRVMHGRTGFDPQSGSRYLRGFYLDRGDVDSKIRVLQR